MNNWKKKPVGTVDPKIFDRTMRVAIRTTGHPRSGNTWVNRLLSDALNAGMQTEPRAEVQYWGKDWDSQYVIRKTHSRDPLPFPCVYVQRDPRDVLVSAMHYRRIPNIDQMLGKVTNADEFRSIWDYRSYVEAWLPRVAAGHASMVYYEDLHRDCANELVRLVKELTGIDIDIGEAGRVCARQSFEVAHERRGDHAMWKGKAGNWKEHFNLKAAKLVDEFLGDLLVAMGYEGDREWWKVYD